MQIVKLDSSSTVFNSQRWRSSTATLGRDGIIQINSWGYYSTKISLNLHEIDEWGDDSVRSTTRRRCSSTATTERDASNSNHSPGLLCEQEIF